MSNDTIPKELKRVAFLALMKGPSNFETKTIRGVTCVEVQSSSGYPLAAGEGDSEAKAVEQMLPGLYKELELNLPKMEACVVEARMLLTARNPSPADLALYTVVHTKGVALMCARSEAEAVWICAGGRNLLFTQKHDRPLRLPTSYGPEEDARVRVIAHYIGPVLWKLVCYPLTEVVDLYAPSVRTQRPVRVRFVRNPATDEATLDLSRHEEIPADVRRWAQACIQVIGRRVLDPT